MSPSDTPGTDWRTSSHSGGNEGSCVEVAAVWRTSSYSGGNESTCVEVAAAWRVSSHSGGNDASCVGVTGMPAGRVIATRDSTDRTGPVLAFSRSEWATFLNTIKCGGLDL
ncbi:DUF397 domain-containing protein [Spirillospora sp. NPDC047279]|uniref:DUF397 domain-containing protein n=1 Tax=Spirillospora sp. NPDC047279 TaxID=3155478 RepID=UPI0033EBF7DF